MRVSLFGKWKRCIGKSLLCESLGFVEGDTMGK